MTKIEIKNITGFDSLIDTAQRQAAELILASWREDESAKKAREETGNDKGHEGFARLFSAKDCLCSDRVLSYHH